MTDITTHCQEYGRVSRRSFLTGGAASATALMLGPEVVALPQRLPRVALADPHAGPAGDTLVCIFLRGGADGLNMVVPHGDDDYYRRRPYLGIPRPDDNSARDGRTVDLDGFFGLHPALAPLHEIYEAGEMAFVQATGSPDETRSHFEAMDLMERGAATNGDYTGWLARHLTTLDTGNSSALRAIGVGDMLPASLTGSVSATALQSIADYHLRAEDDRLGEMTALLQALYNEPEAQNQLLTAAANQIFAAIEVLKQVKMSESGGNGRGYGEADFAQAMQMVAQLIKAEAGVEVACVDLGGWDTHIAQGNVEGMQATLMQELANGLAAFYEDIGGRMNSVTVVVMSEFGRRVQENGGLGTDHGHGGMMMVMGGGIQGKQVFADWPGLQPEQLVGPGDLAITTDYRDVLGELLVKRLNNPQLAQVFPGYTVNEVGLAVPRDFPGPAFRF